MYEPIIFNVVVCLFGVRGIESMNYRRHGGILIPGMVIVDVVTPKVLLGYLFCARTTYLVALSPLWVTLSVGSP